MNSEQTTARWVGALFLLATLTYGIGSNMVEAVVGAPDALSQIAASPQPLTLGALLMLVNCLAVVGIGVLMYPLLKRHNPAIALGYMVTRAIEGVLLMAGVVGLLSLLGESGQSMGAVKAMAVGFNHYAFQIAMLGLGFGSLFFCFLLYQTGLIPRPLALLGLVGYVALMAGAGLEVMGLSIGMVHFIPGGLFELLMPLWLLVYGLGMPAPKFGKADAKP